MSGQAKIGMDLSKLQKKREFQYLKYTGAELEFDLLYVKGQISQIIGLLLIGHCKQRFFNVTHLENKDYVFCLYQVLIT